MILLYDIQKKDKVSMKKLMKFKDFSALLEREESLIEMMRLDQESGLYDTDFSIRGLNDAVTSVAGSCNEI